MKRDKLKLKFNEKNNTVSITFDDEGWEPIHTKIIETLCNLINGGQTVKGSTIAELIGRALILEGIDRDGAEAYNRYLNMERIDIEREQRERDEPSSDEPSP
jgi:hypothetical protein